MQRLLPTIADVIANEPKTIAWTMEVAEAQADFAQRAFELFASSVQGVGKDQTLFYGVYVHARKMAGLAVLSALRQHRIESAQSLRQVIEAISTFGYLAMHPGIPGDWGKEDATHAEIYAANEGVLRDSYSWMKAVHPTLSKDLKHYKDHINRNATHTTILNSSFVFDYANAEAAGQRFFDVPDAREARMGLFVVGKVILLAMCMLAKLSRDANDIRLRPALGGEYDALLTIGGALRLGVAADFDKALP